MQRLQRVLNGQPLGMSSGFGTVPGMVNSRFDSSSSTRGMDSRRPSVYGCRGFSKSAIFSASSTT